MLSLEQQLPYKTRLSLTFTEARTYRDLLLVDTTPFQQGNPRSSVFDSSGILTQRQLKVEVSNRLSKRVNLTLTGALDAPWGLRLSPFIVASSSRPFNIITGQYQDTDIPFTGRPVLAADPTQPDVIITRYEAFQLNLSPGQAVIARNFG